VLVRVDFPTEGEQSEELKTQNTALAEGYNVRGYPTLILLNPKSQKIGTAKYQPGGPDPLIKEIEDLRRREFDRRTLMSEQVDVQKKKPAPAE
jgi:protein disulfide-isomerase